MDVPFQALTNHGDRVEDLCRVWLEPCATEEAILDGFERMSERAFEALSALLGDEGARAAIGHALKRTKSRFPCLKGAIIRPGGVDTSRMRRKPAGVSEVRHALKAWLFDFLAVLEMLGGVPLVDYLVGHLRTRNDAGPQPER